MMLIRFSLLLAIYGISCCYSSLLYRSPRGQPDASGKDASPPQPEIDEAPPIQYFEQKLTHFDESDPRVWDQEYRQEDKYYKKGGPAYLWIEGTDDLLTYSLRVKKGYWVSHAKKHNAMLFALSHRFHYFSQIMEDTDLESLLYLNVSQVLSDCAAFIKGMNNIQDFPKNTKWIVFGSSYGGNLAAWMRTQYPELVHGAVASSAPVLAKMQFPEYLNNIGSSIESFNKNCRKDIALANEKLDEMVKTESGRKEIGGTFKLCDPLDGNSLSASVLMNDMMSYIVSEIETDLENKKLKQICDTMLENADTKTPVQRYAHLMNEYLERKGNHTACIVSNFNALVGPMKEIDMASSSKSGRSWLYQLCTEFGWFKISSKKLTTFSKNINLEFYIQLCSTALANDYDKKFISQSVDGTNKLLGGLKLNTPRTLFVHGTHDPWRNLGITSTKKNKKVEVVLIKGGTHASDTSHEHLNSNYKERKVAIDKIMATLDSWLKQ